MGPVLIFDKSFLESLNVDEAVFLDQFFLSNITPVFFIETLADLEKEVRKKGKTPEEVVGNIAYKTPEFGKPNVYHQSLLEGELSGSVIIDMKNGRPHISGGRTLELNGKTGVYFQPSIEEESLQRWQNGEFLLLERQTARSWRKELSNIDLEKVYEAFQGFFSAEIEKPKTLKQLKVFVDSYLNVQNQETLFDLGLKFIGVTPKFRDEIIKRWKDTGKKAIKEFAPYFTHVFSVDLFFYLAIATDLISRGRPSHKIDISYLYYLPFCMVFTSNDKLHSNIVPLFLRNNQSYIAGNDLKEDLKKLDEYYSSFPEEIKEKLGLFGIASFPPDDTSFITTQLWDKHMSSKWRENKFIPKPQKDSEVSKKLMQEMKDFEQKGNPIANINTSDGTHHMVIKRMVRGTKGKWKRFPPEVMNRRKNENGDWEDIK